MATQQGQKTKTKTKQKVMASVLLGVASIGAIALFAAFAFSRFDALTSRSSDRGRRYIDENSLTNPRR